MKVLTQLVKIENENFVLFKDTTKDGTEYFGTVPYTEIDKKGCLKRRLNGFDMCISFNSAEEALDRRYDEIKTRGLSEEEITKYYIAKKEIYVKEEDWWNKSIGHWKETQM